MSPPFDYESLNPAELKGIATVLETWRGGPPPSIAEAAGIVRQVLERRGPIVDGRGRTWSMNAFGNIVRMGG